VEQTSTYEELLKQIESLQWQLEEATDTIHAIRTGQVDAIVVHNGNGPELYSLKTADQTYRVFIEQMSEGALTLNMDGIILYCNSMFAKMVGLPLYQVIGQDLKIFIPKVHWDEYRQLLAAGWEEDTKLELCVQGADGLIPCQLSVTTLQLDEGEALSMIVTDLSYQKEIQHLLEENNQRLERTNIALERSNYDLMQFASVASHDLQEPLRKIMVFSGLIQSSLTKNTDKSVPQMLLNKIITSSLRMKELIADILAYSRLAKDGVEKVRVNLKEVIYEIIDDFEVVIEEKGAQIIVGELPEYVMADKGQMRQVFQNLISNALKFSRRGVRPHVTIGCEGEAEVECVITISDNGIGFNMQYEDKIFNLFQRLNTKDKFEGSGIGLSVTKKIIDKHGGRITVSSEEGVGSVFRIVLPLG
jgi:PAS domain S-box-containing protein